MEHLKALLTNIDPRLWYGAISLAVFFLCWLWRRVSMASWDAVTRNKPALQQLPALILGALFTAAPAIGVDAWKVVQDALIGALFGGLPAIGLHVALRAAPVPYNGANPPPKTPVAVDPGAPRPPAGG